VPGIELAAGGLTGLRGERWEGQRSLRGSLFIAPTMMLRGVPDGDRGRQLAGS